MSGDRVQRFLFEDFPVRGELVRLDATWRAVLDRHDYPPPVRELLGELLAATSLLASTMKYDGRLTVQMHGDGPLNMMVAQCTDNMTLRGLARWTGDVPDGTLRERAGNGRLAITYSRGKDVRNYQGIVALGEESIADCLQDYFANSVQVPTRLWTASNGDCVRGMLLQRLPGESEDADAWRRVQMLAGTVTDAELLAMTDVDMLRRLFAEEDVRVFEAAPVSFRCNCSRERVKLMLRSLGAGEIRSIVDEQGAVRVVCEFCNREQTFDAIDAERLFAGPKGPDVPRTLH